ncbi:PKD repeat protein [Methanolinea mesophila]|uniref:PKD domain-containing protein n=1 Tax=Methanolinea mesophila TaxID=547055 RepID=UPI001AE99195|nr:PKD domain-containing protein [Methanolinea mesophila]MBP1929500.1 PKD repeat protein [Methanolinea mesophila]
MKSLTVCVISFILLGVVLSGCTTQPTGPATPTVSPVPTSPATVPATNSPNPAGTTLQLTVIATQSPRTASIPPPIAQFSASPVSGVDPLTVHFTDESSLSPDHWAWDFGDGSTSNERNPVHVYTASGTYTVSLVVSNAGGSNSETKYYFITVNPAYRPPGASFTANPPTVAQPYTVEFIDTSTGPPTHWSWSFGDGGSSTEQNPVHSYPAVAATWYVTLNVTNPAGSSETTGTVTFGPQSLM